MLGGEICYPSTTKIIGKHKKKQKSEKTKTKIKIKIKMKQKTNGQEVGAMS